MLSRTADHLFWMSRYTERAENTARMLNVSYEMSLLPQSADAAQAGWEGLLSISELIPAYTARHGEVTPANVLEFMVRDGNNPSSILSCLRAARENARAVRGALTTEVWETQNQTWLELHRQLEGGAFERDPGQFFEWVKYRSHLSRGVVLGTMLQDEAFHFLRMGTFLERADNTARLLDVKFHARNTEYFGTGIGNEAKEVDFYHWSAVLRSVTLIDTPGIESLSHDVSARSAAFLVPDDAPSAADAIVFVAKSWDYHVHVALGCTLDENLDGIADSVKLARAHGR